MKYNNTQIIIITETMKQHYLLSRQELQKINKQNIMC